MCPVCGRPLKTRNARTCGRASCVRERMSEGGRQGGLYGPRNPLRGADHQNHKGTEITYGAAHYRARIVLKDQPCSMADGTCVKRLHVAFRHDAPVEFVRIDPDRGPFYVGPAPENGYMRLCSHHHAIYDGAGLRRKRDPAGRYEEGN